MQYNSDIIIVGGGLAGLTSALILSKKDYQVTLFEQKTYPFHRVCGEYISNEVLPLLNSLDIDPFSFHAKSIDHFLFSSPNGKSVDAHLPLGGFSVSRFTLDNQLLKQNMKEGTDIRQGTKISSISFDGEGFRVEEANGRSWRSKIVLGAFGKISNLDRVLHRPFFFRRSPYLAVKYHRTGSFSENLVALHNFHKGYCGVSVVDNDMLNVCYLTSREWLKKYGSIELLEKKVLYQNPFLRDIFENTESSFNKPLVINAFSFAPKSKVHDHILMAGDSAGLITPLCGNGMAMAIHAAAIASAEISDFMEARINRQEMERNYKKRWKNIFQLRLKIGRALQKSFQSRWISENSISLLKKNPSLLRKIIKLTHGKVLADL